MPFSPAPKYPAVVPDPNDLNDFTTVASHLIEVLKLLAADPLKKVPESTIRAWLERADGRPRAIFRDDFFGPVFNANLWGISPPVAVLPGAGGTQLPGGWQRLNAPNNDKNDLESIGGLVDRVNNPKLEARVKLGDDGTITAYIALVGLMDQSFANAAYLQFSDTSGVSTTNWVAITGSEATQVDTGVAVVAGSTYRLVVEEFSDRVEFSVGLDPDGVTSPPIVATITTNLPANGAAGRLVSTQIVSFEAAIKSIDLDWIEMTSGRLA